MMSDVNQGAIPKSRVVRKKNPDNTILPTDEQIRAKAVEALIERKSKLSSLPDRLAGSTFHYRNWYYPEGKDKFPQHDNLRYVGKMYPYAEGGQLLIDEPRFPYEFERCDAKKKVLHDLGYRYIVLREGMTLLEAIEELNNGMDNSKG